MFCECVIVVTDEWGVWIHRHKVRGGWAKVRRRRMGTYREKNRHPRRTPAEAWVGGKGRRGDGRAKKTFPLGMRFFKSPQWKFRSDATTMTTTTGGKRRPSQRMQVEKNSTKSITRKGSKAANQGTHTERENLFFNEQTALTGQRNDLWAWVENSFLFKLNRTKSINWSISN